MDGGVLTKHADTHTHTFGSNVMESTLVCKLFDSLDIEFPLDQLMTNFMVLFFHWPIPTVKPLAKRCMKAMCATLAISCDVAYTRSVFFSVQHH